MSEIFLDTVVITKSRWQVTIRGVDMNGNRVTYIASADSAHTYNDGIWFGTEQELEEERA